MLRRTLIAASTLFLAGLLAASTKPAPASAKVVDEGTFAIFQNGARIATEEFSVRQLADSNSTSAKLHSEMNGRKIEQTSELKMKADGSFVHYEWKETAPEKSSATVTVGDHVLVLQSTASDGKPIKDQEFFLGPETFILDDYAFISREVLMWRYLATSCAPRKTGDGCDWIRQRFPVLVPRQRTSAQVFVEFKGYENMPLNGRPQKLRHFVIQSDGSDWHLWLDEEHKLQRISIPDANTEILRQ